MTGDGTNRRRIFAEGFRFGAQDCADPSVGVAEQEAPVGPTGSDCDRAVSLNRVMRSRLSAPDPHEPAARPAQTE